MRQTRLACVIAALLALTGAWAGPVRTVESTRLVVACAWPIEGGTRVPHTARLRFRRPAILAAVKATLLPTGSESGPVRRLLVAHHLFQRPPPAPRS